METKVGIVQQQGLSADGLTGKFMENGTTNLFDFEIIKPNIYVVPGDSIKVLFKTPSGRQLNIVVVIDINGKEV